MNAKWKCSDRELDDELSLYGTKFQTMMGAFMAVMTKYKIVLLRFSQVPGNLRVAGRTEDGHQLTQQSVSNLQFLAEITKLKDHWHLTALELDIKETEH